MNDAKRLSIGNVAYSRIDFLKIFKPGDGAIRPNVYFFGNGRQQCRIGVEFLAINSSGQAVTLSPQQIATDLKLVSYNGGAQLGSESLNFWGVVTTANQYVWNETLAKMFSPLGAGDRKGTIQPVPADNGHQVVYFYVTCAVVESLRVAVEVMRDGVTSIAQTYWEHVKEDDGRGDGNGKFNSSVLLNGVAFVRPAITDYQTKLPGENHKLQDYIVKGSSGKGLRTYEQYISLSYKGFAFHWKRAVIKGLLGEPYPGFSVWNSNGQTSNGTEWALTYVIQPGETSYRYASTRMKYLVDGKDNGKRSEMEEFLKAHAPSAKAPATDKILIGQIMSNDHWQISNGSSVIHEHRSENLYLMDESGNEHYLRLYLPDGNHFNYVAIDTWSPTSEHPEEKSTLDQHGVAPNAFSVNRINIVPDGERVYGNGRQQIRVEITVEAREGGMPTPLTEEEKASIVMLDYDSGMPLGGGWSSSRVWNRYTPFPDRPRAPSIPRAPGETEDIFISAEAITGVPLKLAFRITMRDNSTYVSTGMCKPADGDAYYDPAFDIETGVTVRAERPERYAAEQFTMTRSDERAVEFDDRVVITLRNLTGQVVPIRTYSCEPRGMIHWQTATPGDSNPCFIGYCLPGGTAINWDPAIAESLKDFLPGPMSSPEPGRAMFVLCGRAGIRLGDHGNLPRGPLTVYLIDDYGSDQSFRLAFRSGERDELTIS